VVTHWLILAIGLAGCQFSLRGTGSDGGGTGDATDATGDGAIDAFDSSVCPPAYTVAIGSSRYALTATNRMAWTQSDLCNDDLPGSTHLVILETVGEAMQLMAELRLLPTQPVASRYWVGAVQDPLAAAVDAGWSTFAGQPLDPALWSNFGVNLIEPDDNGDLIENRAEQLAVIDLTVTVGYLVDLSGLGNSGAVCECDGRAIAPLAQAHIDADPNKP
jgi:hypothetical protein